MVWTFGRELPGRGGDGAPGEPALRRGAARVASRLAVHRRRRSAATDPRALSPSSPSPRTASSGSCPLSTNSSDEQCRRSRRRTPAEGPRRSRGALEPAQLSPRGRLLPTPAGYRGGGGGESATAGLPARQGGSAAHRPGRLCGHCSVGSRPRLPLELQAPTTALSSRRVCLRSLSSTADQAHQATTCECSWSRHCHNDCDTPCRLGGLRQPPRKADTGGRRRTRPGGQSHSCLLAIPHTTAAGLGEALPRCSQPPSRVRRARRTARPRPRMRHQARREPRSRQPPARDHRRDCRRQTRMPPVGTPRSPSSSQPHAPSICSRSPSTKTAQTPTATPWHTTTGP